MMGGDSFVAAKEIARLIEKELASFPNNHELQEVLLRIKERCLQIEKSSLAGWYP